LTLKAALAATVAAVVLSLHADRELGARERQSPASPKLMVIVVVDQMRFDYFDRFAQYWTSGLKRFHRDGAVFERGFYPYLNTVTCAGHATIATGTYPYAHGVIMNEWYQRDARRRMSCTDDPSVKSVPYTPPGEPIGHSAHRLRTPTIGDRLRAASPSSRVVTVSMKPRSTVMLAGHGGTAVTWFGDSNVWGTSTAFAPSPLPEVKAFVDANPVEHDRGIVWNRLLGNDAYGGADENRFERPHAGWTSQFPHPLAGAEGSAADRFFDLWERSPYSDAYLGRLAAHLVRSFELGQRDAVDYLGVSFSSVDYVGHDFGPESQEVQDTLVRLDRTLGELFDLLDKEVGRNRYVVGLSADHGVSRIPEMWNAEGTDAGRVLNSAVQKVAETAMTAAHGPGPHVALVEYTNLYLTDAARARAESDPSFIQPILDAVSKVPGVQRVFPSRGLESRRASPDPIERAAAISHHPKESGEVVIVLKPNWIGTNSAAATHGSAQPYDQHVPVMFLGSMFKAGRYTAVASPADLAPTLAATVGLAMPNTDGRVLKEALAP
jgi:predicted AlkP superfamily pyrophosphatase or phosphodiesterase